MWYSTERIYAHAKWMAYSSLLQSTALQVALLVKEVPVPWTRCLVIPLQVETLLPFALRSGFLTLALPLTQAHQRSHTLIASLAATFWGRVCLPQ